MKKKYKWLLPLLLLVLLTTSFLIYAGIYYHAGPETVAALESDFSVSVEETDYGWFFDGPSEDDMLVFYPGGKVEETAYSPLLHLIAEKGMDVCLIKMPLRFAFLGINKADDILEMYDHPNKYIGGHSLGGAMAAYYACGQSEKISGVILFAAYPTKKLNDDLLMISIYGSNDKVLNMDKVKDGREYVPRKYFEYVIEGGNHAQFGNYGKQNGDGEASISAKEQQEKTVTYIFDTIMHN